MKQPLLISVIIFSLIGVASAREAGAKPPANFLLASPDISSDSFYKKILLSPEASQEKAKIQFLIARIRKTPHGFLRNGVRYGAGRAATHMAWKLSRKGKSVRTAKDFIEKIASQSSLSGEKYLLKAKSGETFYVGDILWNELNWLEKNIAEQKNQKNH